MLWYFLLMMNHIVTEAGSNGYRVFVNNKRFTIALISDLHLAERYILKASQLRRLRRIIDQINPDLIINLGDFFCKRRFISPYHTVRLFQNIIGKDYPWTFAWGNHDYDAFLGKNGNTAEALTKFETFLHELPNCLYVPSTQFLAQVTQSRHFSSSPTAGSEPAVVTNFLGGNFNLDLIHKGTNTVAWRLFILNSRRSSHIPDPALNWLQTESDLHQSVPALCFFHIPTKGFADAWESGSATGIKGERISYSRPTDGFHDLFKQTGTVRACFAGHDHANDFRGTLDGIDYIYARKTLRFGYGARDAHPSVLFPKSLSDTLEWGVKRIELGMDHVEPMDNTINITTHCVP